MSLRMTTTMSMCHVKECFDARFGKTCHFLSSRVPGQMPGCPTTIEDLRGCESGSA